LLDQRVRDPGEIMELLLVGAMSPLDAGHEAGCGGQDVAADPQVRTGGFKRRRLKLRAAIDLDLSEPVRGPRA
jgi:hypothetical protein